MRTFLDVMLPESNKSLSRQVSGCSLTQRVAMLSLSPQDICSLCDFVHHIHNTIDTAGQSPHHPDLPIFLPTKLFLVAFP